MHALDLDQSDCTKLVAHWACAKKLIKILVHQYSTVLVEQGIDIRQRSWRRARMQSLCVVLLLVGVTLADPTVFFMEKFETGEAWAIEVRWMCANTIILRLWLARKPVWDGY